jgi:diguanylate cyclase (GGDEF)-like protein
VNSFKNHPGRVDNVSVTTSTARLGTGLDAVLRHGRAVGGTVRSWLPRGNLLRPGVWAARHRMITRFALLQSVGLAVFALAIGSGPAHSILAFVVVAAPASVGLVTSASRRIRVLSVVFSLMSASMTLVDLTGGITEAHFHFFVMLGVAALYQDWSAFGLCVLLTVVHHAVMGVIDPKAVFAGELERANPVKWAMVHGGFILAASITHVIAWKLNEQQELQDSLTRLPNRFSFVDRLEALLTGTDEPVAVLFVDIDNFKTINDTSGHHVGDLALYHAARTMAGVIRSRDVVGRIGGDEFAVIILGTAEDAGLVAERILTALQAPMSVGGREVFVTASIGIADTLLAASRDPQDLLRDADLAMYMAKSSGKNRVVAYTPGLDKTVLERAALLQDLRSALELGQFELNYQPTFTVTGAEQRMCGVEALLRWRHPERGMVPPMEFIALAEESGDIKAIGAWVLRTAAAQVAAWQRELPGCEQLEVAVNLSPAQLRDPALLPNVSAALHESGLASGCLILEVTETMLLSDLDRARRQLDAVRAMGAQVAIDDFGTGYSSLSYLARLPADQVKIDRSFVTDLAVSDTSVALVRSIVQLARALNLDVQAEGVEEIAQQRILSELGCPRSQGFLYSRPLSTAEFVTFATKLQPPAQGTVGAAGDLGAKVLAS